MGRRGGRKGGAGQGRKTSEDFLEKNAQKEGVQVTDSGLQYLIIDEGDEGGLQPVDGGKVRVDQRVTLVDGKIIGDTFKDGAPDTFTMDECIDGYREGLLMMREGSRYKLFVPPDIGWGKKGAGTKIPPNSVVIFDVRLRKVL